MAKTFQLTIDDHCCEVMEGVRKELWDGLQERIANNNHIPWFADKLEDLGGFMLYVLLAYCQKRERSIIETALNETAVKQVTAAEVHIAGADVSAEEIS